MAKDSVFYRLLVGFQLAVGDQAVEVALGDELGVLGSPHTVDDVTFRYSILSERGINKGTPFFK